MLVFAIQEEHVLWICVRQVSTEGMKRKAVATYESNAPEGKKDHSGH